MNIRLTYDFCFDLFQTLFPGIELFNWERDKNIEIDLLVFPGGEDVGLERYLERETIEEYGNLCHVNKERDSKEIEILQSALNGILNVKKIFGVCRGLQLFSVMFGGSLYFDLPTYGYPHPYIHDIKHRKESNIDFFKVVNSMHHQGIKNMGDNLYRLNIDRKAHPINIATDNSGMVVEIGSWLNDKILGVQFHPEFYEDSNEDKTKFKKFINSWVNGETTILKGIK